MLQDLIDRIFRDPETGVRREVVGLRELAQLLDVCYKTLLRAVHAGRLQAVHIGQQWKVGRDALEPYMDTPQGRRLPKFRQQEPIDDPWGGFPESRGFDANGEDIPF
jgi:excisionase family DNA binding protein